MNKSVFGLNHSSAIRYVDKIANNFSQTLDISIEVDRHISLNEGYSFDGLGVLKRMIVGAKELYLHNSVFGDRSVLDRNFMRVTIALFHEIRHTTNALNDYMDVTKLKSMNDALAINFIAKHGNVDYYKNNGNYTKNIIEIDAEKHGVMGAYKYLKRSFPKVKSEDIEKIFVDYINDRIQQQNGFEDVPYQIKDKSLQISFIDDVEQAFDAAMYEAVYGTSDVYKKTYIIGRGDDEIVQLIRRDFHKSLSEDNWSNVRDAVIAARNVDKDRIVASLVLYKHPEYLEEPVVRQIESKLFKLGRDQNRKYVLMDKHGEQVMQAELLSPNHNTKPFSSPSVPGS